MSAMSASMPGVTTSFDVYKRADCAMINNYLASMLPKGM